MVRRKTNQMYEGENDVSREKYAPQVKEINKIWKDRVEKKGVLNC